MQLPPLTPIGSYLVIGVDHADRLVWLEAAKHANAARSAQKKVPADVPLVALVQVANNALGPRRPMAGGPDGPVFLRPEHLVPDAGLVLAADGRDAITAVIHAPDLDGAYAANRTRVPASVPRVVIGTVRHRYRSVG